MTRHIVPASTRAIGEHVPVFLLWAGLCFFLWMFLVAESLERTAAHGRFLSADGTDAAALAERYSYEWRHGMVGDWPLFVPGFFAVAIATVLWSSGQPTRHLLIQGSLTLLLALLAARLLTPLGTRWLVPTFERDTGLSLAGSPMGTTWSGTVPGVLTVMSWTALIVAIQRWVTGASIWLLLVPLVCYAVLAAIRPGDVGDLIRPWGQALWRREGVAIVSAALIPLTTAILWWYCVRVRVSTAA